MKINRFRYYITYGTMEEHVIDANETPKMYVATSSAFRINIKKEEDDVPTLKDRTSYPYVDFYSTKNQSREYAIQKICEFFAGQMQLGRKYEY